MQNHCQDIYFRERRLYGGKRAQKYHRSNKEDKSNSDMSIDYSDSDQPQGPNLNLPLQTDHGEVRDYGLNLNLNYRGDQNLDFGNWSTQASSLNSTQSLKKNSSLTANYWTGNNFSAKFAAPVKQSNRGHFKSLLKDFDRQEFSGKNFMNKLRQCEEEDANYSIHPEYDEGMSLESHLESLSRQYMATHK